ncbi:MAG: FtsX-like permease family protein [Saprospiraceae bacterium]|nr:FtsX-like permease family protein [Saprospiraceae bacterium]
MLKEAIRFIQYDKAKSIGVVIGIVISTFLIGQQIGIATFLTSLMSGMVDNSTGDIWVVDSRTTDANSLGKLDVRKVREIRSIEGVAEAYPMVLTGGTATFPNGKSTGIILVGSEAPAFAAGPLPEKILQGSLERLQTEAAVSADLYDAPTYEIETTPGTEFEINGKRAVIGAQTNNLRGFGGSMMYTTLERARYFGNSSTTDISAVVVNVKPGYTPQQVRNQINRGVYGLRAWVRSDFSKSTVSYVLGTSGIGASTGTLVVFAVISGFFIIGLTMYSSALDRIRDYGTLKAIGASNGYIRRLILLQAAIFALVGFAIAFALLEGFRQGVQRTGLIFGFSWPVIAGIFAVTLFIALSGAIFALRRITGLEPAAVFRG